MSPSNCELYKGKTVAHWRWSTNTYWVLKRTQTLLQNRCSPGLDPGPGCDLPREPTTGLGLAFSEAEQASLVNFQLTVFSKRKTSPLRASISSGSNIFPKSKLSYSENSFPDCRHLGSCLCLQGSQRVNSLPWPCHQWNGMRGPPALAGREHKFDLNCLSPVLRSGFWLPKTWLLRKNS